MSEHNPNAWQNGFDAWQNGYDDAMYDGIDTSSEMPCKCQACLKAYDEGQQEAIKEIFGSSQSAQQNVHPTCGESAPLQALSTPEADTLAGHLSTPPTSG